MATAVPLSRQHLITEALLLLLPLTKQLYPSFLCYLGLDIALHPGSLLHQPLLYPLPHRISLDCSLEGCLNLCGTSDYDQRKVQYDCTDTHVCTSHPAGQPMAHLFLEPLLGLRVQFEMAGLGRPTMENMPPYTLPLGRSEGVSTVVIIVAALSRAD